MDAMTITEAEIMQALEEAFAGDTETGDRFTTADYMGMFGVADKTARVHIAILIRKGKCERAGTVQGTSILTGARTNAPAFRLVLDS